MRILMIQPNYHSGGAEIAGNWPPSWVPYVGGALKAAGFNQVCFIFGFDESRILFADQMAQLRQNQAADVNFESTVEGAVSAPAVRPMICCWGLTRSQRCPSRFTQ